MSHASNEAWNPIGGRLDIPAVEALHTKPMEIDGFAKATETLRRSFSSGNPMEPVEMIGATFDELFIEFTMAYQECLSIFLYSYVYQTDFPRRI